MESKVLEILKGYSECDKLQERFRLEHDDDARYYYTEKKLSAEEALHADTIISFWMPYKTLCGKETGWKIGSKTHDCIDALLKYGMQKTSAVNTKIEAFAQVCYTKGNFILLPKDKRAMNNARFQCTEDRIDFSIYECFPGGRLAGYFSSDEACLISWIKTQRLESLFDGEIKKANLICVLNDKKVSELSQEEIDACLKKKISAMTSAEIWKYLEFAVKFITERTEKV